MIDFQGKISFQKNITHITNPNFTLSKKNIFKNLLKNTTSEINNENCIWFRNNGVTWHTLYSIEDGYKELLMNGKKYVIFLPKLFIHIGKNELSEYDIDIYFQNTNDKSMKTILISPYFEIDKINLQIKNSNYVKESSEIIDYIFTKHDFKYDDEILKKLLTNEMEFYSTINVTDLTISDLIDKWKNEIDNYTDSNLLYRSLINQNSDFVPMIANKTKLFMGIYFETMKNIKLGNKKYIVYDIQCCDTLEKSIESKFKNDKILLLDLENQNKITLPFQKIIDSKFKLFEKGKSIITNESIQIGNYLNFDGKQTNRKITKMTLYKDSYFMKISYIQKDSDCGINNQDTLDYDLIDQPKNINAYSIYDLVGIKNKNRKYPLFTLKDSMIITDKKSDKKYSFDDMYDYVNSNRYFNKICNKYVNLAYKDTLLCMLDRICEKSNNKVVNNNEYSYGYIPGQYRLKKLIKQSDDIYIDTVNNFIHVKSDDIENIENIDIDSFATKSIEFPCVINNVEINNDDIYISHHTDFFNRRIKIKDISITESDSIYCTFYTIDDMEFHNILMYEIDKFFFFADKQTSVDGLSIGQYGKHKHFGAVHGFKKSQWHGIKDFYVRCVDGTKMVLFENNIAIAADLMDIDYFNETSKKVKNINNDFLSKSHLSELINSKKTLRHSVYVRNNTIKCEII